jgi:hypothetical protein
MPGHIYDHCIPVFWAGYLIIDSGLSRIFLYCPITFLMMAVDPTADSTRRGASPAQTLMSLDTNYTVSTQGQHLPFGDGIRDICRS